MKFTDFTLDAGLQEGLAEAGYVSCMPVQEQVLLNGLEGADLYVQSQTGTGKTAAYLVTILQRLSSDPALSGKKALVMVPTRELAVQVEEEARILGSGMKLKSASFYGGVGYGGQQELLKRGVDIIIGTPGRVIDLQESGTMDLSQVAFLVIDEADRMFDMGFYPDLRTLIRVLPKSEERQTMLFSATLNNWVKNLAWEYTIEAKEITIEAENVTVDEIDQLLFHVSSNEKMKLLLGLIKKENPESLIVFCNTKRMSEIVSKRLKINGFESEFLIGDLPQSKRLQVIDSFKSGSLRMLVATDVAARGIDVDSLAMVINYDLPNEAENYVHRIGRTARAGKTGKAYSFCSEQDVYNLPAIEKYCESKIPSCVPGEDDYVEDKSAGVYIRTDRYDSDYDDGDDRRGGRSGGKSDRSGRPGGRGRDDRGGSRGPSREGSRDGRSRPAGSDQRRDRPSDSRDNRRGQGDSSPDPRRQSSQPGIGGYQGAGYQGREKKEEQAERDLSKLSFDERMAYYKSKYGSEEAARAAEHERSEKSAKAGNRNNQNRNRNRNASGTDRKPGAGKQSDGRGQGGRPGAQGKSPAQDQRNRNAPAKTGGYQGRPKAGNTGRPAIAKQNPASAAAPAKKGGIASLIKKLFGKK
ncbi:DEAD/DEAH box helicase [Treponema zuelzerae]|uniref:DEAD/DEAH box helicase n=1 Tax=Teretinema zuelzerae TaxID=156 RepID=A0AAE3EGD8_9SPIR|nr:DEAD/DEAH box helicase [Teretinema zuelzerae]MCD1653685.1 DEAD/DEAH box helicase [Teretinema zuelzerae]